MESRKKEKDWKSTGLEKQALFAQDVIDYNEELAIRLEMEYGTIDNPDLKEFIKDYSRRSSSRCESSTPSRRRTRSRSRTDRTTGSRAGIRGIAVSRTRSRSPSSCALKKKLRMCEGE